MAFNKFLLIPLGILVGLGAGAAIAYQQATSLPRWYTQSRPDQTAAAFSPSSPAPNSQPAAQQQNAQQNAQQVEEKLRSLGQSNAEVVLSQQDVNDVLTTNLNRLHSQTQDTSAIKGIHAELNNNQITAGVVLDLSTLQTDDRSSPEQALLNAAIRRIPGIKDHQIYLGIESQPQMINGELQLDPNTRVKVGNLSFKLQDVSQHIGLTPEQLEQAINRTLPSVLAQSSANQIEIKDGKIILRSGQ